MTDGTVEINVKVKHVTDKAILIDHGGKEEVWVPKSMVKDYSDGPDDGPGLGTTSIFVMEWFAVEKGLV